MDIEKLRGGVEEISVSDSVVVEIEGFSHLTETDASDSSRISNNYSRKGSMRGGAEKAAMLEASAKGNLHGGSSTEKPEQLAHGISDPIATPKIHHQITIKKGSLSTRPPPESKYSCKRSRQHHILPSQFIDPRKVLMFFATLSSIGTVLLICFTLSMGKLDRDDNGLS